MTTEDCACASRHSDGFNLVSRVLVLHVVLHVLLRKPCQVQVRSKKMETTPRRSKRFQPLLLLADAESREYTVSLLGSPISIRKTRAVDVPDEDDLDEDEEFETVFYNGFSRAVPIRSPRKRREKLEEGLGESFSVGDTVLVKTQAKTPSVGVIVAIWEIRTKGNSENSTSVKVKVQWFLRPSELPNIRAKRDHLQVCGILSCL